MIDTIGATHSGHVMCGSEDSFAAELLNGLPCLILSICRTNACKLPPHQLRSAQRLLGLRWNFSRVLDGHGKKVQRLGSKHAVATSSFASSLAVIACDRPLRRRSLAPRSALELQLGFLGLTGGGFWDSTAIRFCKQVSALLAIIQGVANVAQDFGGRSASQAAREERRGA